MEKKGRFVGFSDSVGDAFTFKILTDDTKKIMVDFYPLNVDLGDEYMVKLQVNGEVTMLDEWQPYYIENLPMGQNTIGLALVYPDGSAVPGDQTSILQTITLREDPAPQ